MSDFLGHCKSEFLDLLDFSNLECGNAFRELIAEVGVDGGVVFLLVLTRQFGVGFRNVHLEFRHWFECPDGARVVMDDVGVSFADEVHLIVFLDDIVFEVRVYLFGEVPVVADFSRDLFEVLASLHLLHIEGS